MKKAPVLLALFMVCSFTVGASATSKTPYRFSMDNRGPSAYSSTSAIKNDDIPWAYVSEDDPTVYWPRDGINFRVRNASRKYATEVVLATEGNLYIDLEYLSGQNYTGTKWLYGNISDSKACDYSFQATGFWGP